MPTTKRYRLAPMREPLSESRRRFLTGHFPPDGDDAITRRRFVLVGMRDSWALHGEALLAEWREAHPGSRPWGWWMCEAPAPRRCLAGAERVYPADERAWRPAFGIMSSRPAASPGVTPTAHQVPADTPEATFESQAAYLDRLGLLTATERLALAPQAFEPEPVPYDFEGPLLPPRGYTTRQRGPDHDGEEL